MKPDTILLTEPASVDSLYPFSIMHPAWEVRCGAFRLFEKTQYSFPDAHLVYHGRERQLRSFLARFSCRDQHIRGSVLVLTGNILPSSTLWRQLEEAIGEEESTEIIRFTLNTAFIGAYVPASVTEHVTDPRLLADMKNGLYTGSRMVPVAARQIHYLWDTLSCQTTALWEDANLFSVAQSTLLHPGIFTVQPENIILGMNVSLGPCTVLDASGGPIMIGEGATVMPHSTIFGPCFIGEHSVIKAGAKIYGDTSIGEWCKIGGEVENSIIQAYSNKQHDGFLGHSYLCEWVNLGADTNTSDLKNNYGNIRAQLPSGEINTGRMFLGMLCGDHSKSGINTMFNTGTTIGISANIFGGGFPEKYIPSYSWGVHGERFDLEKAIDLARTVMTRRNRVLTPEEEILLRMEFPPAP